MENSMSKEHLNQSLKDLRKELSSVETGNTETQDKISNLTRKIDNVIDKDHTRPTQEHHSLRQELSDSIEYFEISHPMLTEIANRIVYTLNNLGI
ncbi:MAG: DUF4404 family protein [Chitinivibrionales bacterium]|nr:DUF4404 family protein [Chitinivibrionales bacterium]